MDLRHERVKRFCKEATQNVHIGTHKYQVLTLIRLSFLKVVFSREEDFTFL